MQIRYGNAIIDDKILECTLSETANTASVLTLSLAHESKQSGVIQPLSDFIEVFDDNNVLVFIGRCLSISYDWDNTATYSCSGLLDLLNDMIQRAYNFPSTDTEESDVIDFLTFLIDRHNAEAEIQWVIDEVTVTDPNAYISRESSQNPTTYAEIIDKLVNSFGGYLVTSWDGTQAHLSYLIDSENYNTQGVKWRVNMLDCTRLVNATEIATVLIPYGSQIEDDPDTPEYEGGRVDITSVNGGLDYIEDIDAIERYGRITRVEYWDDVNIPLNLLTKGQTRLGELTLGNTQFSFSAVDIPEAGDSFRLYDYVAVDDDKHDIQDYYLITGLTKNLLDKSKNQIVISKSIPSLSSSIGKTKHDTETIIRDYVKNETITSVYNSYSNALSLIQQLSDSITLMVSEQYVTQDDYQSTVNDIMTQIQQTAESITFTFQDVTQIIDQQGDDLEALIEESTKYIRFEDGTIKIGVEGDPFEVWISNDRISFVQSGTEVAYISDNQIYITNGQFIYSLKIGNFNFVPRENGNLSFQLS